MLAWYISLAKRLRRFAASPTEICFIERSPFTARHVFWAKGGMEGVRERVFARPCNDLRMCLARRGAAHRWLGLGEATTNASEEAKSTSEAYPAPGAAFARVLTALERMQGMNPLTRKTGDHVERESSTWAHAVTAETFATTTAKAGAMCAADGLASEKGREGAGANAASRANAADIGTTAAVKDAETRMARDAFEEDADGHEDEGTRPPAERAAAHILPLVPPLVPAGVVHLQLARRAVAAFGEHDGVAPDPAHVQR